MDKNLLSAFRIILIASVCVVYPLDDSLNITNNPVYHDSVPLHKRRGRRSAKRQPLRLDLAYNQYPAPDKPITILIHGTRLPVPLMALIPGLTRQVITPVGLHQVSYVGWTYHFARMATILTKADSDQFPLENFYLFGWSGTLSVEERERAGEHLYRYLRLLRDDERYKKTPITLIALSHGGNTAINTAAAALKAQDTTLRIDRLVLCCCPIQAINQHLIASPLFKQVFHLFSFHDLLQIIDPQSIYHSKANNSPFFSERTFSTPADNLIQAEIRWSKRATLSHIDFALPAFIRRLPALLKLLENTNSLQSLQKNRAGTYCLVINRDLKKQKK